MSDHSHLTILTVTDGGASFVWRVQCQFVLNVTTVTGTGVGGHCAIKRWKVGGEVWRRFNVFKVKRYASLHSTM